MGAFTKLFGNTILENLAVGTTASTAKFTIKGNGSTSATTALLIQNSSNSTIFSVDDVGNSAVSGLLTLAQGNFLQPSGNTAVWFNDGNNPLRIIRSGGQLVNLNNSGDFSIGGNVLPARIYISRDPESDTTTSYTAFFGSNTGGIGRNLNNNNKTILELTTTGGGSVQNAPLINFLKISRGNVTGYTSYRGIEVVDADVLLNSTSGNTLIGSSPSNTAKLSIKGSGSTSATTSLLIQNNSNNDCLKITDDRVTSIYNQLKTFDQFNTLILDTQNGNGGIQVGNTSLGSGSGRSYDIIQNNPNAFGGIRFFSDNAKTVRTGLIWIDGSTNNFQVQTTTTDVTSASALIANSSSLYLGYLTYDTLPASAAVAIKSTTRGFLPPRMTSAQKIAIVSPAEGLMVYDTDLKRPCFHDGTNWITL